MNSAALAPAVKRLALDKSKKVPYLMPLQKEVATLYERVGLMPPPQEVYKSAWGVRKMLGFLKRKCSRRERSLRTGLKRLVSFEN